MIGIALFSPSLSMASNSEEEEDDILDRISKDIAKLSTKGKAKSFNFLVDKIVSPEDDIDKQKLSERTALCLRLQEKRDRLQVQIKTVGNVLKTRLIDIADDLDKHCKVAKPFKAAGDVGAIIGGAMIIGGVISSIAGYGDLGEGMIV